MQNTNRRLVSVLVASVTALSLTGCWGNSESNGETKDKEPIPRNIALATETAEPTEDDYTKLDPRTCYIGNNNVEFFPGGTHPENVELICGTDPSLRAPLEVTRTGDGRGDIEVISEQSTLSGWDIVRPQATMGGNIPREYTVIQVILDHPDVEGYCIYYRDFSKPGESTKTDCPDMPVDTP